MPQVVLGPNDEVGVMAEDPPHMHRRACISAIPCKRHRERVSGGRGEELADASRRVKNARGGGGEERARHSRSELVMRARGGVGGDGEAV